MATGILAIGQYLGHLVLAWCGFMVIGKAPFGIQATGGGRTPAGIYGRPDIATLVVIGTGDIGENLRGHRHVHENHNCSVGL